MDVNVGELDFSNDEEFLLNLNIGGDDTNNCSFGCFWDVSIEDTHVCTHTHTCNPPGPDASHSHTCYHTHTNIISAAPLPAEDKLAEDTTESSEKKPKKCPTGNCKAVRKYREKQKAHKELIETENRKLRAENQRLRMILQGKAKVEDENARLKYLLADLQGKIEGEIGSFPYQKTVPPNLPLTGSCTVMDPCSNMQYCNDQLIRCPHPPDGEGTSGYGQGRFFSGCQGNH